MNSAITDPDAAAEIDSCSYLRPQATQRTIDLTIPTDDELQVSDAESLVAESSFSHEKILSHNPWSASSFADF